MAAFTSNLYIARGMMLGDGFRKLVIQVTGPTLYSSGGDPVVPSKYRLGSIEYWPEFTITDGTTIYLGVYNYTTAKLMFFNPVTGLEVGAIDLSAFIGRTLIHGK